MVLVYRDGDINRPMKFQSADKYSIDDAGILHVHKGENVIASYSKWDGAVIAVEETILKSA